MTNFINDRSPLSEQKLVVMVVANIKQFRIVFYEKLAERLLRSNIELRVVYSDSSPTETCKGDSADLAPPLGVKVARAYFLANRLLVQALPLTLLECADLVVIVQSNGYLMNYLLQLARLLGWRKLAFWGHGYNHQGVDTSLSERLKRWLAVKIDWWFSYTHATGRYLAELGFPENRITVIENAIDTSTFAQAVADVSRSDIIDLRHQLDIPENACIALYCGSLYANKQLEFLLQVGDELYRKHLNFRMIVIGDGLQKEWMRNAAKSRSWLQYCGPQFGSEKAKLFAASDFFLNPGAVGLAILDSFASGLPFITSNYKGHGPEIAYLEHEGNGLMLPFNLELFVEGVCRAIEDRDYLASLREGAQTSGKRYTLENMVINVANGVMDYLSSAHSKSYSR